MNHDQTIEPFLRFVFFSVGRGSHTLVSLPPVENGGHRRYGVIDSNESQIRTISAYLDNPWFGGESVPKSDLLCFEFVALTHYDSDHFNGLVHLLNGSSLDGRRKFRSKYFLYPILPPKKAARIKYHPQSGLSRQLRDIDEIIFSPRRLKLSPTTTPLTLGFDTDLKIIIPNGTMGENAFSMRAVAPSAWAINRVFDSLGKTNKLPLGNLFSSALRFQFGDTSVLIGGDVSEEEWMRIINEFVASQRTRELRMNVVLVPHHGGKGNPELLWATVSRCSTHTHKNTVTWSGDDRRAPTLAIISCGERDSLPSKNTLSLLEKHGVQVRCTAVNRHCTEDFEAVAKKVPCEIPFKPHITRGRIMGLPFGVKVNSSPITRLPDAIKEWENKISFTNRSICVDIYSKGIGYSHHRIDGCRWDFDYTSHRVKPHLLKL